MKFLGDMGISMTTMQWLRDLGHDAVHLRERNQQKLPDDKIMAEALREGRVVLTMDLDFGYLLAVSGATLPSVIIFRVSDERPANISSHLERVLSMSSESLRKGAVISVNDKRHKVRELPIRISKK